MQLKLPVPDFTPAVEEVRATRRTRTPLPLLAPSDTVPLTLPTSPRLPA